MGKFVDNYVLEKKIGKGAFGTVFKGRHKATGIAVAAKSLKKSKTRGEIYDLLKVEI